MPIYRHCMVPLWLSSLCAFCSCLISWLSTEVTFSLIYQPQKLKQLPEEQLCKIITSCRRAKNLTQFFQNNIKYLYVMHYARFFTGILSFKSPNTLWTRHYDLVLQMRNWIQLIMGATLINSQLPTKKWAVNTAQQTYVSLIKSPQCLFQNLIWSK